MRTGFLVLVVAILLPISAAAQSGEEIIGRERMFYDYLKEKKFDRLPDFFDESFNGVFGGGILDKASEVKGFSEAVLVEYRFSNIIVKFPTPEVGIMIYRAYIKGSYKGKDITGESYHTSTYAKKGGKWLIVLHTEVQVPKEETKVNKMKSEFIGIATVIYIVPDLGKAKEWYAKVFQTEPYFDEPFYVGFRISGYELGLQPQEGPRNPGDSSTAYWAVSDLKKTFDRFLSHGAKAVEEPMDVGGGVVVASVKDPWDNMIGLIHNPEFKK